MRCSCVRDVTDSVKKRKSLNNKKLYKTENIIVNKYSETNKLINFHDRQVLAKLIEKNSTEGDSSRLVYLTSKPKRLRQIIVASLIIIGVIFIIITATLTECGKSFTKNDNKILTPPDPEQFQPPSWSKLKIFKSGAVCSDGPPCASIGKSILEKNGSAVDATISTMICNGLVNMQAMGMGGGFMMTIYERSNRQAYFLIARDVAPSAAHANMYKNKSSDSSRKGVLSIAIPGEVAGYWAAHQKFGKIPWAELFEPSIELCINGWNMTKAMYDDLSENIDIVFDEPTLRKIFVDPNTGIIKKPGDIIKPDKLCDTMRILADKGAPELYNGTLGKIVVEDLRKRGSIITFQDFNNYRTKWSKTLSTNLTDGVKLFTSNLPSSGALLAFVLNIFDEFKFSPDSLKGWNNTIQTYHRIIETWKYAYAVRSKMGDADYVDMTELLGNLTSKEFAKSIRQKIIDDKTWNDPAHYGAGDELLEDHGTAQISVMAPNGDAVAVTSSINTYFGSGIASERTGFLFKCHDIEK
ncbi:scoloptoxin SSD14-like isoform X1 [Aphidius gifuensis]|uniref:scoloptoxin SSD14-like isoform X1 n=1 Tax=Aphidius gifuensis TaxID=684658 RepID=UPI001CDCCA80|nr:scoloptoxin SSD14-like isoform X1 [Aphidius gifuensis]